MAIIEEYKCGDCGIDLVNDGMLFYYDSESEITDIYLWLFSTVHIADNSKIKGYVSKTYCWKCKKPVNVYAITEIEGDFENVCEIVQKGIDNYISNELAEINELKEIKRREKYTVQKIKREIAPGIYDCHYEVTFPESDELYDYIGDDGSSRDEVIKEALESFHEEIDGVLDYRIERYEDHIGASYLILDETEKSGEFNSLEKVSCPECHEEINKYVNEETPCPKCGGKLILMHTMCVD